MGGRRGGLWDVRKGNCGTQAKGTVGDRRGELWEVIQGNCERQVALVLLPNVLSIVRVLIFSPDRETTKVELVFERHWRTEIPVERP